MQNAAIQIGVEHSANGVVGQVGSNGSRPLHCFIGGHLGGSTQFTAEVGKLLHSRLRLVTLILLLPSSLFLVLRVADGVADGIFTLVMHALTVALIGVLTGLVWLWPSARLCVLRDIELALFSFLGLFFGWLQFIALNHGELHQSVQLLVGDQKCEMVRLWIDRTAVRWVFLIIIYGVFIPTTWRRCTLVVTAMSLAPLVLTLLGAWCYARVCLGVLFSLLDLVVFTGTASAVAIFGSHRLQVLQRQAFEAMRLGQYRLGRKLGSGGMGEVYQAEHELLRRPCAIKLIRPEQTREPGTLERFEREVRAMATLSHPNTALVFDYGKADDGTFYYVMEYLPGLDLETLITKHGPMPAARVVHFLRQMCRALHEAHTIGLLHRDIKPSNIIAAERGREYDIGKLLDFGLVHDTGLPVDADRLTVKGTVLGSPPFMSPEQAAGKGDVDARTDIYGLGGVGYYLLTGQPPFTRETAMEMLLAHAYEPPVPPSDLHSGVPADVEAVILRCLRKKPAERFATVTEMENALAACACADEWTQEDARRWWKALPGEAETAAALPVAITPRAV